MRRCISLLLCTLVLLPLVGGCKREEYDEKTLFAMDTVITLKIEKRDDSEAIFAECEEIITDTEILLSKHFEKSEVSAFNDSEEGISLSAETLELIKLSLDVSENTGGAFDITCEPLTALWDITSEEPVIPAQSEIDNALSMIGYSKLLPEENSVTKLEPSVRIDLGGVGKGYALGLVVEYLEEKGVKYGTVSFGGNIGIVGTKPDETEWKIGIKNPRNTDNIIGTLALPGGYTAVSGDYERYFISDGVRYHHIIDPATGHPVNNGVQCVAIICDDAALADALSTACFVLGYDKTIELYNKNIYDFEAVFVTDTGIETTPDIEDELTISKK